MRAERRFTVRAVSTFTPDRLYRVYACGDRLAFIKIGGQGGIAEGVAVQFGLLGTLFLVWWRKRSRTRLQQRLAEEDQQDIELLLARDPRNFALPADQVVLSTLEPPARLASHGAHFGIWKIEERNGRKRVFQFEDASEMREAMAVLPPLLGPALTVNAKWDESKKRYTKTDPSPQPA